MTKVLLVEDDKSLREIYGVRLLAEGYDIVSAGDGEEALAMAIKERPQLIVSDVMMPKISGFDMLDILRSTTETKNIKVIMMTALSSEDQRARGVALGADRYLVKSQVGIEDVVRTVHDVLEDAPITASTSRSTFTSPSTPPPRPPQVQASVPSRPAPVAPPTSFYQQQMMAATPPRPQPSPASAATAPQNMSSPQAAPAGLPQPTAPFSTTRPANLGERIIHPITAPQSQGQKPDLSSLMDQELNSNTAPATMTTPSVPVPPPAPIASSVPQPQQPTMITPQQPRPTQAPFTPTPPRPSQPETTGISFEETPRPPTSVPTNPFNPGPQPPANA
jgi:CheY-like chemotaxis protein